nr:glutamate--tRNA ligase, cytoplasmic [Tanacetum cinerariifolium]
VPPLAGGGSNSVSAAIDTGTSTREGNHIRNPSGIRPDLEVVAMLTSGLTASIALEKKKVTSPPGTHRVIILDVVDSIKDIQKLKRYKGDGTKDTTFTKEIWIEQADAKAIVDAEAISPNLEITTMDFGNASIKEIKKASDGNVTELNRFLPPEESVYKATKLKQLTRLPEINELGPLTLVEFGYLLKKKKLGENDDLINAVNPDSRKEILAVGDANMRILKRGEKRLFHM